MLRRYLCLLPVLATMLLTFPTTGQFSIDIDAASIDSNDEKRDQHLRGADFFNVRQFPVLQFRSTDIRDGENGVQLSGDFTMHGVTRQITIPLRVLGTGKGPYGDERIGFLSQFSLKRSDFGMNNMVGPIGDEVSVIMSFEGIKK
jgi:polyisoprenoid-binding protein YceI